MIEMPYVVRAALAVLGLSIAASSGAALAQSDVEAFSRLPSQEVAGAQIGWIVDDTFAAVTDAVERERPLVMVFGDDTSNLVLAFARHVAPCPHLNQLAGAATFAYGSPVRDEFARRIAHRLKLTEYPTIAVIAPRTDDIHALYSLIGFFDAATAAADIYQVLLQNRYWPADRPPPAALPAHYLAYPNMACTPEGARRLGIGTQ